MSIATRIEKKLSENINCSKLEVINESHLHSGHLGDDGSGESHFRIIIKSDDFANLSRVASHRKINQILADELKTIHALAIKFE